MNPTELNPYQSYYPNQFLDGTSDFLDFDPDLLPDDDFDASVAGPGLNQSQPGSTPYSSPAYGANSGWPGSFSTPPLQLGPPSQSASPPWSGYAELAQMLTPPIRPLEWEETPFGISATPPIPGDWLPGNVGPDAASASVRDASFTSDVDPNNPGGNGYVQTAEPANQSVRIDGGEISTSQTAPELGVSYWPPPLHADPAQPTTQALLHHPVSPGITSAAFEYARAADHRTFSPDYTPDWLTAMAYRQHDAPAEDFSENYFPRDQSSAEHTPDPATGYVPSAGSADNPTLTIVNMGGRQMLQTATGFIPFENFISIPPPGVSVPVNIDAVREGMRNFAFKKQMAGDQDPPSLAGVLEQARQQASASASPGEVPQLSRLESAGDAFVQSALRAGAAIPQALQKLDEMITEQSPGWEDPRTLATRQKFYSGLGQRIAQGFPEDPRYQNEFLAHSLPSLAGGLAPILASGVAGRALAAGEFTSALPTAVTLSLQEAQAEYERAIAGGASESVARGAFGFGAGLGAFSGFGLGRIGGAETSAPLEAGAESTLTRNGFADFLRQANAGGLTMAYNRLGELADAHGIAGYDQSAADPAQVAAEVAKSYAQGATLSAAFHALLASALGSRSQGPDDAPPGFGNWPRSRADRELTAEDVRSIRYENNEETNGMDPPAPIESYPSWSAWRSGQDDLVAESGTSVPTLDPDADVKNEEVLFARRNQPVGGKGDALAPTSRPGDPQQASAEAYWQDILSRLGKGAARQLRIRLGDPSLLVETGQARPEQISGAETAAWSKTQKAIHLFGRAFSNRSATPEDVLDLLHETGHAWWDTLPPPVQGELTGLWSSEVSSNVGPLFSHDRPESKLIDPRVRTDPREWFAERTAFANLDSAQRRIAAGYHDGSLIGKAAAQLRMAWLRTQEALRGDNSDVITRQMRDFLKRGHSAYNDIIESHQPPQPGQAFRVGVIAVSPIATGLGTRSPGADVAQPSVLTPYGGPGGGHHVPAKSAFKGAAGYDPNAALAMPNSEMNRLNVSHHLVSATQQALYRAFARTGAPLTWPAIEMIETRALTRNGMDGTVARVTVQKAISALKSSGLSKPARIPWQK